MKTNVTMKSKDRELFGVVIKQDTKNSFLSLTDLQEAYAVGRLNEGWKDKRVNEVLSSRDNAERMYYILERRNMTKGMGYHEFMNMVEEKTLVKTLKYCGAYKTTGGRENKKVTCDPYIWVLVAMEMNPKLYALVIDWLTDSLIINRIEVGNTYNIISRAASKFKDVDYVVIAKALNHIVFGKHETLLRNNVTKEQLKELEDLQKKLAFAIDMGYVKSFSELRNEMLRIYDAKYGTRFATPKIK